MNRYLKGILVGLGIGVSIGLLIALMLGEETRRQLRERFEKLRGSLAENEQLKQSGQQVVARFSQTASKLK